MTNVTYWLRVFRPPLQRALTEAPPSDCDIDPEFLDLLRAADQRNTDSPARMQPAPDPKPLPKH